MTQDELLRLLSEVPTVDRVAAALKDEGAKLRLTGLAGSAIAFVAANVVKQTDRHHLFILSDRESEILDLIAKGLRNKEIARDLGIAEKTVKNHVSNILKALQVNSRTEAAMKAIKSRLVDSD